MNPSRPGRILALDLLRGLAVAAMIVVNNPGNWSRVYEPFTHAAWNGVSFADVIFPGFVFIMGTALSLGVHGAAPDGSTLHRRIAVRTLLLVLMGLTLNAAASWPHLGSVRIPGVLQRLALTYAATALIVLHVDEGRRWVVAAVLLAVHWSILVAGGPLEPATNIAAQVDRWLFGSHLLTAAGDPEGAVGLLSSTATALLGAMAGRWLAERSTRHLVLGGAGAVVLGVVWSYVLPFNKPLWTPSFALFASGVAALALAGCVLVEHAKARVAAAPLLWLGTNALAIYFLSELTTVVLQRAWLPWGTGWGAPKDLVYWGVIAPLFADNGGPASSLAYGVLYGFGWIGVAGLMRRWGIRVRV